MKHEYISQKDFIKLLQREEHAKEAHLKRIADLKSVYDILSVYSENLDIRYREILLSVKELLDYETYAENRLNETGL